MTNLGSFILRYNPGMSIVLSQVELGRNRQLEIRAGDLTEEHVDVIVNAANQWLDHGAGVAAAIIRKGGVNIQRESNTWIAMHGQITHDQPAYTQAGELPCHYVVHAVGPIWGEGHEEDKLRRTILGTLDLATQLGAITLAIPAISTGIYGFPKDKAAPIFFDAIQEFWLKNTKSTLTNIRITIIDEPTITVFLNAFKKWKKALIK